MKKKHKKKFIKVRPKRAGIILIIAGLAGIYAGMLLGLKDRALEPGLKVHVVSVKFENSGHGPLAPPPGYQYAVIGVSVSNGTPQVFNFAPVLQSHLIDEAGASYDMAPAEILFPIKAGPVAPGRAVSGELSYLVPVSAHTLSFKFTDSSTGISFLKTVKGSQ
jgi:hypothetical protein